MDYHFKYLNIGRYTLNQQRMNYSLVRDFIKQNYIKFIVPSKKSNFCLITATKKNNYILYTVSYDYSYYSEKVVSTVCQLCFQ